MSFPRICTKLMAATPRSGGVVPGAFSYEQFLTGNTDQINAVEMTSSSTIYYGMQSTPPRKYTHPGSYSDGGGTASWSTRTEYMYSTGGSNLRCMSGSAYNLGPQNNMETGPLPLGSSQTMLGLKDTGSGSISFFPSGGTFHVETFGEGVSPWSTTGTAVINNMKAWDNSGSSVTYVVNDGRVYHGNINSASLIQTPPSSNPLSIVRAGGLIYVGYGDGVVYSGPISGIGWESRVMGTSPTLTSDGSDVMITTDSGSDCNIFYTNSGVLDAELRGVVPTISPISSESTSMSNGNGCIAGIGSGAGNEGNSTAFILQNVKP